MHLHKRSLPKNLRPQRPFKWECPISKAGLPAQNGQESNAFHVALVIGILQTHGYNPDASGTGLALLFGPLNIF